MKKEDLVLYKKFRIGLKKQMQHMNRIRNLFKLKHSDNEVKAKIQDKKM